MRITKYAVAIAAILALAMPALADMTTIETALAGYQGPITMKFGNYDTGVTYNTVAPGTYVGASTLNALPQTPAANSYGDDSWGVATLTGIYDKNSNPLWIAGGSGATTKVTALFFGETDNSLTIAGSGASLTENIAGTGMKILFYQSPTTPLNGYLASPPTANRTSVDTFTGYTNGTLIWSLNSVVGYNGADMTNEYFDTFLPAAALPGGGFGIVSTGGMLAEVGTVTAGADSFTGADNSMFAVNPIWTVSFTGQAGNGDFLIKSDDPISATVPAPAAVVLGMLGLGLVGWWRKRTA
jgi:hypothetical protein